MTRAKGFYSITLRVAGRVGTLAAPRVAECRGKPNRRSRRYRREVLSHSATRDARARMSNSDADAVKNVSSESAGVSFAERADPSLVCAICRFVLAAPVVWPCGAHSFCFACAEAWMDTAPGRRRVDVPCPLCRRTASASGGAMRADEVLERRLRETLAACGCGAAVRLSEAAAHYGTCELTRNLPEPRAEFLMIRRRVRREEDDELEAESEAATENDADIGDEYVCLICAADYVRDYLGGPLEGDEDEDEEEPYNSDAFIARVEEIMREDALPDECYFDDMTSFAQHVIDDHDTQEGHMSAVCPICASMPHGDPTRRVMDLYDHMTRRHSFDWTLYMPDTSASEYEVLAQAMRESLVSAGIAPEMTDE